VNELGPLDASELLLNMVLTFAGGIAAGTMLHDLHVRDYPQRRRLGARRMFAYVAMLGVFFLIGRTIAAFMLGIDLIPILTRFVNWGAFSAGATLVTFVLDRRRGG
jgi:hypothetical protein